jgi:HlyD family secretion protein
MSANDENLRRLSTALDDHGAEGIEILYSEPSRMIGATIILMLLIIVAVLVWSFIGRADEIVSAPGMLGPEDEVRRVYTPINGELVDVYVAEGAPVSQGDLLARLNARDAIQVAANAIEAELALKQVEQEHADFPARRELMQRHVETLQAQIETAERLHEKRVTEGLAKLSQAQKARLEEARGTLEKAGRARDAAKRELDKFQRLFARPGGGGISKNTVEEARDVYLVSQTDYKLAEAKLGELEFQLSEEYARAKAEFDSSDRKLEELRIEREKALNDIKQEEYRVELKYRSARLAAEAATRITFDNIDAENYLRILAPVSGVVTYVASTQTGDKVQANTPLLSIAPKGARSVLKIDINEKDRAFLREGQEVKMKFSAFPYQRYGFISGTLDYISPSTQRSQSDTAVYKGHVSLDKEYYRVDDINYPLRYGMAAIAEVVIRKRRLIDLAFDPMRL